MASEMSSRLYQQEIMAAFLSDEGAVLKLERVRAKGLHYSTERTVALGIDLARRADWTVLIGMDEKYGVTHFERFKDIDWPLQRGRIEKTWLALGKPALVIDATGVGDPMVQELQYAGVYIAEAFLFTGLSKRQLVESLAMACDEALLTLPDEPILLNEIEAFEMTATAGGNVRYAAPEGQHDDCVMALGLALRGATRFGDLGISIGRLQ
jgi:phage FluMu gp28-like protein